MTISKIQIGSTTHDIVPNGNYVLSNQASSTTISDLQLELRQTHGRIGSVSLSDSTYSISGWYNYEYIPHRNGTVSEDNHMYGTLLLFPMTFAGDSYIIRFSNTSGTPSQVRKIIDSVNIEQYIVWK